MVTIQFIIFLETRNEMFRFLAPTFINSYISTSSYNIFKNNLRAKQGDLQCPELSVYVSGHCINIVSDMFNLTVEHDNIILDHVLFQ